MRIHMYSHRNTAGRFPLAITLIAAVATALSGGARADDEPLSLTNPSFEAWTGDVPAGWNLDAKLRPKGSVGPDKKMAKEGANALKLSPSSKNSPSDSPYAIGQLISIASYAGKQLKVSAWLGAEGSATAVFGAFVLDSKGQSLGGQQLRQDSSRSAMASHDAPIDVPESALNLVVFCAADGVAGSAYFDGIRIATASAGAPPPHAGETAPIHTTIRVDATRTLRRIPRTLYGANLEWAFNANDLWDPTTQRPRAQIVDLMRQDKVSLIRFPGGVFSDYYHWRDGIGELPKRPTTLHYPNGPKSRHVLGTDELIALAQKTGSQLLITVNAGTGAPDEAAEWMRYVDRKAPGIAAAWEIGNELYMNGDASGGSLRPSAYADKVKQFARAMRAVDPKARLGAIGGINYGRYNFISYPDWTKTLLLSAASDIDFIALHNAYAPVLINEERADPQAVYTALMAAPVLIGQNLDAVEQLIKENAPQRADAIKIAVTEWGPFFQISPESAWVDHVKTLGSAVFVADTLRVFIEHPQVEIATFFKLVEPTFMGWIGPKDGVYIAKSPMLAFALYADHFLPELVATRCESPTFDSRDMGVVAAVKDAPFITAVTSKDSAAKRLCMMLMNKSLTEDADAEIEIAGVNKLIDGTCRLLTGNSIDAHTGTKLQPIPGFRWGKQRAIAGDDFNSPDKGNVRVVIQNVAVDSTHVKYRVPAHSVACLEFSYE